MERYRLENVSDPNVNEILESNTRFEAAFEALEKLGWRISLADPDDVEADEEEDDYGPKF